MSSKTPTTVKELNVALADLSARLDAKNDQLKEDLKAIIEVEIQPIRQSIEHKHAALKKELPKLIEKELKPLKEAMEFINKQFEEFKSEIGDLKNEIAIVRTENRAIKNDFSRLTTELKETRKELTELQQYSRRNNVEIKGVPVQEKENLVAVIKSISTYLKVDINESDLEVVHRVPTREKSQSNIIAKFISRIPRDKFMNATKKQRLTTTIIGFEGSTPLYINDHLCPANKVLLGKALKAKRENNWKFTWVSGGKILMRKTENSRVLHITCAEDLSQIS